MPIGIRLAGLPGAAGRRDRGSAGYGAQPIAEVQVQEGREVLVALDQRGQAALQLGGDLGQFAGVRRLDGLLGRQLLGQIVFVDDD